MILYAVFRFLLYSVKILNFVIVVRLCRTDIHIVKVFFSSPLMKMWKFSLL